MSGESSISSLFEALKVESRRAYAQNQANEKRKILSFSPTEVDQLGHSLFSGLQRGGYCTFIVSGRHGWDPRSYYFEAARQAAARGRDITRVFLLPNRHYRSDATLLEHIGMDREAGIKIEVLLVGDLLSSSSVPLLESLDFGVWDDEILCIAVRSSGIDASGPSEWRVSARPEDVQHGRELIATLRTKAPHIVIDGASDGLLNLEEPMISTAPIASFLSTVLCHGNHVSQEDCSWYHGIWQYLRVFNLVSTPTWHSQFYFDALRTVTSSAGRPRILISGTADYSMLAHVLWVFPTGTSPVDVTILDMCESPLFLCRWYSKSVDAKVDTVSQDILRYRPTETFDCIVTDAFLTRFSPEERNDVVRQWSLLLRPGGLVITTTRIERPGVTGVVRATPAQADAFRHRAMREAKKWADFLAVSPSEIGTRAQRYAERMTSHPIVSEKEARALFTDNGFEIRSFDLIDSPGEMLPTTYAEIVASKSRG